MTKLSPSFQKILDEVDAKFAEKKFRWNQAHKLSNGKLIEKSETDMMDFKRDRDAIFKSLVHLQELFDRDRGRPGLTDREIDDLVG